MAFRGQALSSIREHTEAWAKNPQGPPDGPHHQLRARKAPPDEATAPRFDQGYGQGWTQLTDEGKMHLSKKETNVFIFEGTKASGIAACAYSFGREQAKLVEAGSFTLTCEMRCSPGDPCQDTHAYLLMDSAAMSGSSSGCDFTGVSLRFDMHELRVEKHRPNQTARTLFAQPGCAVLRAQNYVTLVLSVRDESISLSLSGVTIISNLPVGRLRTTSADRGHASMGIAVCGRTRCYLRRFRITSFAPTGSLSESSAAFAGLGQALAASSRGQPQPPLGTQAVSSFLGSRDCQPAGSNSSPDALELTSMVEHDIVCADLKVKFQDIGGLADAKKAVNEAVLLPLILPEFFTGPRKPWKGVLLFGPPGTGKTMLAKAVASCPENITFFNCSTATLTSKWRGESDKLLKVLFATARSRVPAILFFDELDSLLSQRGSGMEHEASGRIKSDFLIQMDGLAENPAQGGHLMVLATTNAPWDLDEALRRRLEKRIYIPLPDEAAMCKMLQTSLAEIKLAEDVELSALAADMEGYSGADVQLVCREASMSPMRRMIDGLSPDQLIQRRDMGTFAPASMTVRMADFQDALKNIQPSVARGDAARYAEWACDFGSTR